MASKKKRGKIIINRDLCKGCHVCVTACPQKVIIPSKKLNLKGYYPAECKEPEGEKDRGCTGCTLCAVVCPDVAIEVYRE